MGVREWWTSKKLALDISGPAKAPAKKVLKTAFVETLKMYRRGYADLEQESEGLKYDDDDDGNIHISCDILAMRCPF